MTNVAVFHWDPSPAGLRKTVKPLAVWTIAELGDVVVAGADIVGLPVELVPVVLIDELPVLELPPELIDAAESVGVGTEKPVTPPVNGPGGLEALAPMPTRLGEGAPGSVPFVPSAAAWNAVKTSGDALIVLVHVRCKY